MTDLIKVRKEMKKLQEQIEKIMQMTKYRALKNLSAVEYDNTNLNDLQMINGYSDVLNMLGKIEFQLAFLNQPMSYTDAFIDEYSNVLKNLTSGPDSRWSYLLRPVAYTDTLTLYSDGRYGTSNGRNYYTSGTLIEFEDTKDTMNAEGTPEETPVIWTISSVEHNGKDYYIVGYPDVDLNGLRVRVRE